MALPHPCFSAGYSANGGRRRGAMPYLELAVVRIMAVAVIVAIVAVIGVMLPPLFVAPLFPAPMAPVLAAWAAPIGVLNVRGLDRCVQRCKRRGRSADAAEADQARGCCESDQCFAHGSD